MELFHTQLGRIEVGDCLQVLAKIPDRHVNLIMTSPPFPLLTKKDYGNVHADEYTDWFLPFAREFHRVLSEDGSLVLDFGGVWKGGMPTRHLYQFQLAIALCEEIGFHLAQEFYWWNPTKLPAPIEWVARRRVRAKDAVDIVWWFSKTPWPKADNRRVLAPYSRSMKALIAARTSKSYRRPSGHRIKTDNFRDAGGSIPPNLLAIPNSESNTHYLQYCRDTGLPIHPARFPSDLPEFFIRMLTDPGDLVVDPFAGSCVTGEAAERLGRRWLCVEIVPEYAAGGVSRFQSPRPVSKATYYQIPRACMLGGS